MDIPRLGVESEFKMATRPAGSKFSIPASGLEAQRLGDRDQASKSITF
jgi:hypothetical protein